MNISIVNCYSESLKIDIPRTMKMMVKLVKEKSLPVTYFGKSEKISDASIGFYGYEDCYLRLSGYFSCRETLTNMLNDEFKHNPVGGSQVSFILVRIPNSAPITKYSNAKITKFALNFLGKCSSYRWNIKGLKVLDKSTVKCFNIPKIKTKMLIFAITSNDRGKSYTTASALIAMLKFPQFIFTPKGNERKMSGIIKALKAYYLKHGGVGRDTDLPANYFGFPHYSAYFILWLVFAEYRVSIYTPNVLGPIDLMRKLNKRSLRQSNLRQNYSESLVGVLKLGDKFLMKLGPTIYSFLEERKEALNL